MQQTFFLPKNLNIVLQPGQTKEEVLSAIKSMNEFSYPDTINTGDEVHVEIRLEVVNGKLDTAVRFLAAEPTLC